MTDTTYTFRVSVPGPVVARVSVPGPAVTQVAIVSPGPPGPRGPAGAGGDSGASIAYVAGEPLSALRVVRVLDPTSGTVVYARAPEAEALAPIGVTAIAATSGEPVAVITDGGELTDPSWGWQVGKPVVLDAIGTLTQSQPSIPYVLVIGIAIATDTIAVRIEPPIFVAA